MFEKSLMRCAFAGFVPILTTIEAIPGKPQKHSMSLTLQNG